MGERHRLAFEAAQQRIHRRHADRVTIVVGDYARDWLAVRRHNVRCTVSYFAQIREKPRFASAAEIAWSNSRSM